MARTIGHMGWFDLFDRLRLRASFEGPRDPGGESEDWSLPGSQLRIMDRGLAALYRGAILAAGSTCRADMFDLAGHFMARTHVPRPGQFHLDARLTGRRQQILFGEDPAPGIIAWHAPSLAADLRLPCGQDAGCVTLAPCDLAALLSHALPLQAITSLSAWVSSSQEFTGLLQTVAPWLTADTRMIVRASEPVADEVIAYLPQVAARCAAIVPCTGAADTHGRGEDPTDLLLCLEDLSRQSLAEAMAPAAPAAERLLREVWNGQERARRTARQGGVTVLLPLHGQGLKDGWTVSIVEDVPGTPVGMALAALQTTPYRAASGFDYVAEVSGARLLRMPDGLCILPIDGPVLIEPADPAGAIGVNARGAVANGQLSLALPPPVHTLSDRPAFLLGAAPSTGRYLTEIWPRMEYLFQRCEQEQLPLDAFDVLVPGGASALVRDSLMELGLPPWCVRDAVEGVLFRRLLVVPPASHADRAQRSAAYDAFWTRRAGLRRATDFVSFSRPQPADRLFLTAGDGESLLNPAGLAAVARQRGFQVVSTRDTDFTRLTALLAGARMIIGDRYSLVWSVLASECAIGVLLANTAAVLPHAVLHAAAARGHSVAVAFGSAIGAQDPNAPDRGFAVAPAVLEALIDRLERVNAREPGHPTAPSAVAGAPAGAPR